MQKKRIVLSVGLELWERVRTAAFKERISIAEFFRRSAEERLQIKK